MIFISMIFQVAELKRKLELEEMRKFRQMSRPFSNQDDDDPNAANDETFLDHLNEE